MEVLIRRFLLFAAFLILLCAQSWAAATPVSENCEKTLLSTSYARNGDKLLTYSTACGGEVENYQTSPGKWASVDLTKETTIGGWRVFQDTRVAAAIKDTVGKVRIYPDKTDLNTHLELDIGAAMSVEKSGHSVVLTRTVTNWDADIVITIKPDGMKKLITFRDKTKIPDTITLGLTLTNLTLSGRNVQKDGVTVFTLPNMFAYAEDDPLTHYNVPETLNGTQAIIDLSAVKPQFPGGQSGPWYVDPSVTIQPSSKDNQIVSYLATNNYGSLTEVSIYQGAPGQYHRSILTFDISSIPSGATVSSSSLSLYFFDVFGGGGGGLPTGTPLNALRLTTTDWAELSSTWNNRKTGTAWTTAGGDFTTTNKATITSANPASKPVWETWDITALTNDALNLSLSTLEVILKIQTETSGGNTGNRYYSKDYAVDTSLRPKLEITYTTTVATCPNTSGTPIYCLNDGDTGTLISTENEGAQEHSHTGGTPCYGCVQH